MADVKVLTALLQAKAGELDKLVEQETHTNEDVLAMKTLRDEVNGLSSQVKQAADVAGVKADLAGIKQFIATPVLPVGHDNGVTVLGFRPSGETILEGSGRRVEVHQIGAGLMEAKMLSTIRADGYKDAFFKYLRTSYGSLMNTEQKALQEGLDPSGGYMAPEEWVTGIVAKDPTPTRVAGRATQLTASRDTLSMPKINYATDDLYSSGIRATWTGEIPASATVHRVTDPVFGVIRIPIYTCMLSMLITNDMLEDSAFPLQAWVTGQFAQTLDLLKDNMVLNGTGVGQPSGILMNPGTAPQPLTVASGAAAALTADGLISLIEAIPEQYEDNTICVLNKTNTGQAIRKLKDGQGRYLWDTGNGNVVSAKPVAIAGCPYIFSGFMPNVGAGTYPIICGDLSAYYLVNRIGFSVQVFRELYAETNQILLLGRARFGGAVARDWKLRVQVVSA